MAAMPSIYTLTVSTTGAEQARTTESFVNTMGVDTHFKANYAGTSVFTNPTASRLLGELGLRHIRDDMPINSGKYRYLKALYANYGIRVTWTPVIPGRPPIKAADLVSNFVAHPFFEAFEGPNEVDGFGKAKGKEIYWVDEKGVKKIDNVKANDYSGTRAFMSAMYAALNGDPRTAKIPVLAPPMAHPGQSQYLKPIRADYANMHSYPNGREPSEGLEAWISDTQKMFDTSKPIIATETGYHNATRDKSGHRYVSQRAAGKYMPRLYATYFNRGIAFAYPFTWVDFGTNMADRENNFGAYLNRDLTPKPAYTHVKNLISLLKEGTWNATAREWKIPTFTPGSLEYTLSGNTNEVRQTLLQKSTGAFYLLLWQDVNCFFNGGGNENMANWKDTTNAPVTVTLKLGTTISSAAVYSLATLKPIESYIKPTSLNLNVPDEIIVVKLVPALSRKGITP